MHSDFDYKAQAALNALQNGNILEAQALSTQLNAHSPSDWRSLYVRSEVAYFRAQYDEAIDLLKSAIPAAPDKFGLRMRLVVILLQRRRRAEAVLVAREVEREAGPNATHLWFSARTHVACNDESAALKCLEQAAALDPSNPEMLHDLALRQFHHGEVEAAERTVDRLLEITGPDGTIAGHACYIRSLFKSHTPESNHVAELESMLAKGFSDGAARSSALCGLARELEDLGEYSRSAEAMGACAQLVNTALKPDASNELHTMRLIEEAWKTLPSPLPEGYASEEVPIFIVGLPRTGTTLTERILMRDSRVQSVGELPDFMLCVEERINHASERNPGFSAAQCYGSIDLKALGMEYMRGAREVAHGAGIFIDKMHANFLFAGIIACALPNARIVHVARDPMDAAWAIHKTIFTQAMPLTNNLVQLADYIIAYTKLMNHWQQLVPDRILTVRYEDLVADPERQSRRLIAWCGLSEDAAPSGNNVEVQSPVATPSSLQVRQPINDRSVGKWRHYAELLEPAKKRFQAAGLIP